MQLTTCALLMWCILCYKPTICLKPNSPPKNTWLPHYRRKDKLLIFFNILSLCESLSPISKVIMKKFDRKNFLKTSTKEGQHKIKICVFFLPRKDDIFCALRRPLVLTEVVVRRWLVRTKWLLAPGSWRRPNLKWFKTDRPPNERRTDRRLLISIIRLLTAGRLPTPSPCLSAVSFTFSQHRHRQFLNGVIRRP